MKTVLCQHGCYSDATWELLDVPDRFDFQKAKNKYKKQECKIDGDGDLYFSIYSFIDWLIEKGGCVRNTTIPVVDLDELK